MSPILSDAEIAELCRGLKQSAARIRFLRDTLKIPVARRPDGTPLVLRKDVEGPRPDVAPVGPNWTKGPR